MNQTEFLMITAEKPPPMPTKILSMIIKVPGFIWVSLHLWNRANGVFTYDMLFLSAIFSCSESAIKLRKNEYVQHFNRIHTTSWLSYTTTKTVYWFASFISFSPSPNSNIQFRVERSSYKNKNFRTEKVLLWIRPSHYFSQLIYHTFEGGLNKLSLPFIQVKYGTK